MAIDGASPGWPKAMAKTVKMAATNALNASVHTWCSHTGPAGRLPWLNQARDDSRSVTRCMRASVRRPARARRTTRRIDSRRARSTAGATNGVVARLPTIARFSFLEDRAMHADPSIFKAYDIRGIVGRTIDETFAEHLGRAFGSEALAAGERAVAVGRDGRMSGPGLVAALIRGLVSTGLDVVDLGPVTTPMLYYVAATRGAHR